MTKVLAFTIGRDGSGHRRRLHDRGIVGAYSACRCRVPGNDGNAAAGGVLSLGTREPGTEQQRVACTPDVLRLYSWEIPNVERSL